MPSSPLNSRLFIVFGVLLFAGCLSFLWLFFSLPNTPSDTSSNTIPSATSDQDASIPLSTTDEYPEDSTATDTSSTTDNADFGSCDADAQTYCSGFSTADWESYAEMYGYTSASWKLGLVDCLNANRDKTSSACDESLDRRQGLNVDVNTACKTDRVTYCPGVVPSPGSEPQVDCLMEHYDDVSDECSSALDAHEAAKPSSTR